MDAATAWRLFIEDPWYQQELHRAAGWLARRARLPHCQAEDLSQEAMLILRSRLTRKPDLRLNRALAADHFEAWLRRVIRRHCLDALRRSRLRQRRCESLPKLPQHQGRV
ncbi:MAG: sigma factor, partial [Candidatus Saccharimonadales bacterium]